MTIKPWTKVGEPHKLVSKWEKCLVDQMFIDHRGKEVQYTLFGGKIASIVLPVTEDKKVVAIRQFRAGANNIVIELPGGTSDHEGESPEEVMVRELEEETGYRAGRIIKLFPEKLYFDPASSMDHFHGFLALDCRLVNAQKLDSTENIEIFTVPLKDWVRFVQEEVSDAKTTALTIKALPHLNIRTELVL